MMVWIILNRPLGFMKFEALAGMMMPSPACRKWDTVSITISALPSMIWAKVSNGEIFSVNPSPLSKDMMLILPVDFLIIVLITTELGTYSMISTIMCDFAFSSSVFSIVSLLSLLFMIWKLF